MTAYAMPSVRASSAALDLPEVVGVSRWQAWNSQSYALFRTIQRADEELHQQIITFVLIEMIKM